LIVAGFFFDNENRIAVWRVKDRGGRDCRHRFAFGKQDGHVHIHAGSKRFIGVGYGRLDADVAGPGIHLGVDGGDGSLDLFLGELIDRQGTLWPSLI
jgi:hypothetical protein